MTTVRCFLTINGRGDCRLNKRRPSLAYDEVAFSLDIAIPPGWGRIYEHAVLLALPEPPELPMPVVGTVEREDEQDDTLTGANVA